jgi:hypothetical protein
MSLIVEYVEKQQISLNEFQAIADFLASRSLTITTDEDSDIVILYDDETNSEITSWRSETAGFALFQVGNGHNNRNILIGITDYRKGLRIYYPMRNKALSKTSIVVDSSKHKCVTKSADEEPWEEEE